VTEETLKDPKCLNLKPGGSGGFYFESHEAMMAHQKKAGAAATGKPKLSMRKPIITPDGEFQTSRECAAYYNMDKSGVLYRVKHKNKYLDWSFKNVRDCPT